MNSAMWTAECTQEVIVAPEYLLLLDISNKVTHCIIDCTFTLISTTIQSLSIVRQTVGKIPFTNNDEMILQ